MTKPVNPPKNGHSGPSGNPMGPPPAPPATDHGPDPYAANIKRAVMMNRNFRTAYWTGAHLQMTLMNIAPFDDIGIEMHPHVDQFLYIESGRGLFRTGPDRKTFNQQIMVGENSGMFVPAGTWHNVVNITNRPLRLFSIYAPQQHPKGTVHRTKADAAKADY